MLTAQEKYLSAVNELAKTITRNKYGDFSFCSTPQATLVTGRGKHTRLPLSLRATRVDGWRKGFPIKSIGYVATEELLKLYDQMVAEQAKLKRIATKAAIQDAAQAAGLSVADYKKQLRTAKTKAEAIAHEKWAQEQKERESKWLKVVESVLEKCGYDFTSSAALQIVLEKIDSGQGVGKAWNQGEFSGGPEAFARCVLGAAHRHENTNYEYLLKAGYDREDALAMAVTF